MLSSTKSRFTGKTLLQTLFFFLLTAQICFAQWIHLGLDDKVIKDIATRNSTIFAVTSDSAVYRSTDNGITWLQIVDSCAIDIAIAPSGLLFMVASYFINYAPHDSFYESSDNGNTWVNLNIMGQLPFNGWIFKITVSSAGLVFCGGTKNSFLINKVCYDPPQFLLHGLPCQQTMVRPGLHQIRFMVETYLISEVKV
jgi:hypothetical protein